MAPDQATAIARLHVHGISKGFLSRMGETVLADLYAAIDANRLGFVFVAIDADGEVAGYVAGATSVGALYRSIVIRHGWRYIFQVARYALRPRMLMGIIESVFYPAKTATRYPDAELLSIVVRDNARGTGVADELLEALKEELTARGCDRFKLTVGSGLDRANAFYRKHGFKKVGTIESHGRTANVMVYRFQRGDA